MKIAAFYRRADGTYIAGQPVTQERLTFQDFQRIHGGQIVPQPSGYGAPPDGFAYWRTAKGEIIATRNEG